MCYMILTGRNATEEGHTLCAHNNDLQGHHAALFEFLPARHHERGSTIAVSKHLTLPQVPETYACSILKVWRGYMEGDAVAVNEHQVAVAGGVDLGHDRSAEAEVLDPLNPKGISGATRYIALQRSRTARECVEWIGRLYNECGISYTCGVGIADTRESWYIEAGGGSCWLAVRVPDDAYMVQSNGYRIGAFDPTDTENVICSPGLVERLKKSKRARTEEGFDFAGVFGGRMREVKGIEYLNARRLWGALRRFNPSTNFDPLSQSFPLFVRPEKKLRVQDLMGALRDRFEGTEYDAFPAEGGFGNHRPIGVPSCVHSNVIELRSGMPADVGAVLWGLLGSPHTSPYIPLHLGVKTLPTPYMTASPECDAHCAFWAFRKLTNLVMVNFRELFPLVSAEWQALEEEAFSLKPSLEETVLKTWKSDPGQARHMLGLFADSFARRALEKADVLAERLNTEAARGLHRHFSHESLSW